MGVHRNFFLKRLFQAAGRRHLLASALLWLDRSILRSSERASKGTGTWCPETSVGHCMHSELHNRQNSRAQQAHSTL